jgi:hypothetical protein
MARATPRCVNSAFSTKASLTGCSIFSTLAAWRCCCWVATKPAMADQIYDNYIAEMEDENNAKDDKV